jgi:hypothetical protein
MNARELGDRFKAKVAEAATEKDRQIEVAANNVDKRADDASHCKRAMEQHVIPLLSELKQELPEQFSFSHQIDISDHKPVGVSFQLGDGPVVSISTALGTIIVARSGDSGTSKGVSFVYPPDAEPYISNSGDLTRDKISKLLEMVMDSSTT